MVLELSWKALLKSQMGSYLSWTQPKSRREKTVVDEGPEDRGQSDQPIPVQVPVTSVVAAAMSVDLTCLFRVGPGCSGVLGEILLCASSLPLYSSR